MDGKKNIHSLRKLKSFWIISVNEKFFKVPQLTDVDDAKLIDSEFIETKDAVFLLVEKNTVFTLRKLDFVFKNTDRKYSEPFTGKMLLKSLDLHTVVKLNDNLLVLPALEKHLDVLYCPYLTDDTHVYEIRLSHGEYKTQTYVNQLPSLCINSAVATSRLSTSCTMAKLVKGVWMAEVNKCMYFLPDFSREVSVTIVDEFVVTDDTVYELGLGKNTEYVLKALDEVPADGLPHTSEALAYAANQSHDSLKDTRTTNNKVTDETHGSPEVDIEGRNRDSEKDKDVEKAEKAVQESGGPFETKNQTPDNNVITFLTEENMKVYIYNANLRAAKADSGVCPSNAALPDTAKNKANGKDETFKEKSKENGPLRVTKVVTLSLDIENMASRCVMTSDPVWQMFSSEEEVRKYYNQLTQTVTVFLRGAEKERMKSLAITAMSSDFKKVPTELCTHSCLTAVTEYSRTAKPENRLAEVHFTAFTQTIADQLVEVFTARMANEEAAPLDFSKFVGKRDPQKVSGVGTAASKGWCYNS